MNHWDKKIQKALKQREIVPSEKAWDKLEHMLDDDKSITHKFWLWKYAAAVILIGGLIGYFLLETGAEDSRKEPSIALEKVEEPVIINNEPIKQPDTPAMNAVVEIAQDGHPKIKKIDSYVSSSTQDLPKISKEDMSQEKKPSPKVVAHENQNLLTIEEDSTIMTNIRPKQYKSAESYLLEAMDKTKTMKQPSIVLNKNSLLNSVEEDLFEEQSDDLLDKITNQLKEAQLALKERNIQE